METNRPSWSINKLMLHTELYIKKKGIDSLISKYSLESKREDGLIILDYNQINSPKTKKIVRECRSLCLETDNYTLVSRSFFRFYNYSEYREDMNKFDWGNCWATEKLDGSLTSLFYHNGKWKMRTRGSFGSGKIQDGTKDGTTFSKLFFDTLKCPLESLDKTLSYCFELCSPYTQVVKYYSTPSLYLLSIFRGEKELNREEIVKIAHTLNFTLPSYHNFSDIEEVRKFIESEASNDKTYEGVVLQDINNVRFKVKSIDYLRLHRLKNNGNIFLPKNIIKFILDGEEDELMATLPETTEAVMSMKGKLDEIKSRLFSIYNDSKDFSKRDFATLLSDHPQSGILFMAYDCGDFESVWRKSEKVLLNLF